MTKQQMKVVAQAEHEMFCLRDLLEGSVPAKVMNRAYEYVICLLYTSPAAFPIVEDAREEQADGTEATKTARAGFSEAEINAVLCHGSGFSKGKFRIAEWYGGNRRNQ